MLADPLEQHPRRSREYGNDHNQLAAPLGLHALDLADTAEQLDHIIVRALVLLGLCSSVCLHEVKFALDAFKPRKDDAGHCFVVAHVMVSIPLRNEVSFHTLSALSSSLGRW